VSPTDPPGHRGPSGASPASDASRFPAFSEAYRQRWVAAGNWAGRTLHDVFDALVESRPDDLAIATRDRRYSFREFKEISDALAAGLLGVGVGREDLVSVQLPNWPEFCFLQIALSRVGAVIQPMHLVFREREIRSLLGFCETDVAIVPESFGDYGYADVVRGIREDLPQLRLLVVARGSAKGPAERTLDALIGEGRENLDRLDGLENDPDAVFYLNFTSGTEGNPKGFLHTHNTLISMFKMAAEAMSKLDPGMVNLACSPMTHSFGHFTTYQCAMGGIPMVLVDRYRPLEVLELIEREKVTSISGTPAHMIGILHHPEFSRFDTSSVKSVGLGGARSAPDLIDELEQVWGCKSANTYGMGETILHTRTMPFDPPDKIRDTVGRPMFGAELKIVDPNDRTRELPAGEVGEIAFRGPTLFVGYYKQPELTAETRDDEGWFYTGDLGFADDDGYLCFAGRAKEVINRGGSKIYPKEIEDLLSAHPKILDVAVVGMPDERLGERVCAYVVTQEGAEVGVDEIREFLEGQKVTKYLFPERIIRLDEMPMTPTGKIRKATLQQDVVERLRAEEAS
jgi:acyl-CoA synthetase (AMP-forming)/AMP-acid ligase II